jgi:hypothetical protein
MPHGLSGKREKCDAGAGSGSCDVTEIDSGSQLDSRAGKDGVHGAVCT